MGTYPPMPPELKQECVDIQVYVPLHYKWLDHGARHAGTWVLWIPEDRKSVELAGLEALRDPFDVVLERPCPTCQPQASAHAPPLFGLTSALPLASPFIHQTMSISLSAGKNVTFPRKLS